MSQIKYLEKPYKIIEAPVARSGGALNLLPGQNEEGYGSKITTDKVLELEGRTYRIYATCFGNAPSLFIMKNGRKYLH
jgi:hypothetical protein